MKTIKEMLESILKKDNDLKIIIKDIEKKYDRTSPMFYDAIHSIYNECKN